MTYQITAEQIVLAVEANKREADRIRAKMIAGLQESSADYVLVSYAEQLVTAERVWTMTMHMPKMVEMAQSAEKIDEIAYAVDLVKADAMRVLMGDGNSSGSFRRAISDAERKAAVEVMKWIEQISC